MLIFFESKICLESIVAFVFCCKQSCKSCYTALIFPFKYFMRYITCKYLYIKLFEIVSRLFQNCITALYQIHYHYMARNSRLICIYKFLRISRKLENDRFSNSFLISARYEILLLSLHRERLCDIVILSALLMSLVEITQLCMRLSKK